MSGKARRSLVTAILATACPAVLIGALVQGGGGVAQAQAVSSKVVSSKPVAATPPACPTPGSTAQPLYLDTSYSFAERAADLVSCMTLSEKVQQLHTNNAPAIPRLGVQQYTYWSEGQHGLNRLGADTAAGGQGAVDDVQATSFPVNFASTMSWDPSLIYQETTAISDEARGYLDKSLFGVGQNNLGPSAADYGSLTYWAPTVNLDRDPRWGRTDEAFGEDPYLNAQMSGAFVDGYQGETITGQPMTPYLKVAATAKHYALNNVEDNRLTGDSVTTQANLRDYYTKQFQSLIENSHVAGLMTSYNAVNGTPSAVNTYTVNEIAQRTYGFDGYTTSDCDAIATAWQSPPNGHQWAAPGWTSDGNTWTNTATGATIPAAAGAEAYGLRAGTQLNCTGDQATLPNIEAAINAGILSAGVIDTDLTNLFTMRMETGEFDPASSVAYTQINKSVIQSPAHQALAEQVAAQDMVLLKNDNVTGTSAPLLPANAAKLNSVVVVGDLANKVTLGGYSGDPSLQVNAVQGITSAMDVANPNATVTFDACGTSTTATAPASCSSATQAAIASADLVIVFVGTDETIASEGNDRTSLAMPGNYDSLISQVAAIGNPHTALVIQSDGPVDLGNVSSDFSSILFSGYNGESQGTALANVLFGQTNPSGHLDFTWYADDSQLPAMTNYGLTASQTGGLGRTYEYFTGTPTYPFGYGLSYTNFQYSSPSVTPKSVSANGTVHVSFNVTNSGTVAGATVAQLYVSTPGAGQGNVPLERLAAFQKTSVLQPGHSQHITLTVNISDLSLWDTAGSRETVSDGTYQFMVSTDASSPVATDDVQVSGSMTPTVQYVTVQPGAVVYQAGKTFSLTGTNPWLKDDTDTAEEPDRNMNITADGVVVAANTDQSFVNLSTAKVSYSSSDPSVASVDANGLVRAVKDGAATITVTVNGVSGSAPIVVQGTVTDSTPVVMPAGSATTASATFTNGGTAPVSNVALSVTVPSGWTATSSSSTTFAQVAAGATATATWQVTPAASATPQAYTIGYAATSSEGSFSVSAPTNVPYASLAAAYDNTGISNDNAPAAGAFDGGGLNFSAQALAADGFVSGQPVTVSGVTFTWPGVNVPDNIVGSGQAIPVSGSGSTLGFLGASNNGTASGTGTVVYTDGTSQTFALGFADWWAGSAIPGTSIAAAPSYLNNGANSSQQTQTVHVYYAGVPIDPTKTVAYVVLPDVTSNGQVAQITALHVFAIGFGS